MGLRDLSPWEGLRAHPVDGTGEVAVGNRRIPCLDPPHRLRQSSDSGAWVKHNLRPVEAVHHPVLRVVAAVADVHSQLAVDGVEDAMASVALWERL